MRIFFIAMIIVLIVHPVVFGKSFSTGSLDDYIYIGDYYGCTGDTIDVDVMIHNDTTSIDAFTLDVAFDGAMLEYIDCAAGQLNPGWIMFGCNEADPGSVRMAGFSLPPVEVPAGSDGVLAVLTFKVTCEGCVEGDFSEFAPHQLLDDLKFFEVINGLFTFHCHGTSPPTPTPTPTSTPTRTPTVTRTPIPTNTPTSPPPTYTPTPKPTETPECDYLGTRLIISQEGLFRTGDIFWLDCHVCNDSETPMTHVATAVLLGVYGEFWFWPGWTQDFDMEYRDYEPGLTVIQVFEQFNWPDIEGHAEGLEFYSGLIDEEMNDLIGEFGYLKFGYKGTDPPSPTPDPETPTPKTSWEGYIDGSQGDFNQWFDTGIELIPGQTYYATINGIVCFYPPEECWKGQAEVDANGYCWDGDCTFEKYCEDFSFECDLNWDYPFYRFSYACLLARQGENSFEDGCVFKLTDWSAGGQAQYSGKLYLLIYDYYYFADNTGGFHVRVDW